jgi:hypothetical protein
MRPHLLMDTDVRWVLVYYHSDLSDTPVSINMHENPLTFGQLEQISFNLDWEKSTITDNVLFGETFGVGSQLSIAVERVLDKKIFSFGLTPQLLASSENESSPSLSTWIQVNPFTKLSLVNEMVVSLHGSSGGQYIGKEWQGLTAYTRQAYLTYLHELHPDKKISSLIKAGRFYTYFGPGRTGQLFLGQTTRPLDMLLVRLGLFGLTYSGGAAQLNRSKEINRYLSYHRLEFRSKRYQLAISEGILYGGENRRFEWSLSNPMLFFYGEQVNGPNLNGNILVSMDSRIFLSKNISLYGEFMIDDFQFDHEEIEDLEPNELGLITGLDLAISSSYVGLEYVKLTNRTYKTEMLYESYYHRGEPIGYNMGSDLKRVNAFVRHYLSSSIRLDVTIDVIWQGEGETDIPWDAPWRFQTLEEGYSEISPTGIVEQTSTFKASITRKWTPLRFVSGGVRYQRIVNMDHLEGRDESSWGGYLQMSWAIGIEADLE